MLVFLHRIFETCRCKSVVVIGHLLIFPQGLMWFQHLSHFGNIGIHVFEMPVIHGQCEENEFYVVFFAKLHRFGNKLFGFPANSEFFSIKSYYRVVLHQRAVFKPGSKTDVSTQIKSGLFGLFLFIQLNISLYLYGIFEDKIMIANRI